MLEELLIDKNTIKVIEHLLIHERWAQNQKDICDSLKIYPRDVKKILDRLVFYDLIHPDKKIGKSVLYALNFENSLVRSFSVLLHQFTDLFYQKNYIKKPLAKRV